MAKFTPPFVVALLAATFFSCAPESAENGTSQDSDTGLQDAENDAAETGTPDADTGPDDTPDTDADTERDTDTDPPELRDGYNMPHTCEPVSLPMADDGVCGERKPDRVPVTGGSMDQLFIRGDTMIALVYDDLESLNGDEYMLADIHTVWGCDDEWWAAGDDGMIYGHSEDGAESYQLPNESRVSAGQGCGDDVLVGGDGVWRRDADTGDWDQWVDKVPHDIETVGELTEIRYLYRSGPWTFALSHYGAGYVHNADDSVDWWYHGRTDDLNSGALLRADGHGFSLHYGYGLYLDLNVDHLEEGHVDTPLTGTNRIEQVTDDAYWLIGDDVVRYVDGDACHEFVDIPRGDHTHLHIQAVDRDDDRLWMTANLYSPDGNLDSRSALLNLHREQGWCLYPDDP